MSRGALAAALACAVLLVGRVPSGAQKPAIDVTGLKATVVSVEAPAAWLLELDRGFDIAGGRVRTVGLTLDPGRLPARPITLRDRLAVDGRLVRPALPGEPPSLQATRIEHLVEPGLRHAYYLFRAGAGEGCAECYVPLLLAADPITASTDGVEVIVTFERDSIWAIHDRPAEITEFAPLPRTLRLDGRPYRFQEVPLDEAIRLLRNPLGSIPTSRPMLAEAPTTSRRRALLFRLGVSD